MDAGASLTVEVVQAKTDQLGYTQTCGKGQMQHRPIPDAELRARIWRVEQRLHLLARQIANQCLVDLLHRNRVDPARLVNARWQPILQAAEQGVDSPQGGVPGPRPVAPVDLHVLQVAE